MAHDGRDGAPLEHVPDGAQAALAGHEQIRGRALPRVEVRPHGDRLHEPVRLDRRGQFADAGLAVEVEQGARVAPIGGDAGHGDLAQLGQRGGGGDRRGLCGRGLGSGVRDGGRCLRGRCPCHWSFLLIY